MFTGIVEEKGKIIAFEQQSSHAIHLRISAKKILDDLNIGDSIAINGICLTVVSFDNHSFSVDVMPETIVATSLRQVNRNSVVNLERAMAANGRFGGHFVSGHVDGVGEIVKKERKQNAIYYDIKFPQEFKSFFTLKGSVTVDGVSLTIFNVSNKTFTISLIPHTVLHTVLGEKGVGDVVNLEGDMLIKHVQNLLSFSDVDNNTRQEDSFKLELLKQNGFV